MLPEPPQTTDPRLRDPRPATHTSKPGPRSGRGHTGFPLGWDCWCPLPLLAVLWLLVLPMFPQDLLSGSRSQLSLSLPQLPNLKVGSHTRKNTGSRATPTQAFLHQLVGPRDHRAGATAAPLPQGGSGPQGWQPCSISLVQMALEATPGLTPPSLPALSASQEERP